MSYFLGMLNILGSINLIFLEILRRLIDFVEVSKLSLFVRNDDFFFFFDAVDDSRNLIVQISLDSLKIISLNLIADLLQELFLLDLKVYWWQILDKHARWVWSKPEEVSEYVINFGFLLAAPVLNSTGLLRLWHLLLLFSLHDLSSPIRISNCLSSLSCWRSHSSHVS